MREAYYLFSEVSVVLSSGNGANVFRKMKTPTPHEPGERSSYSISNAHEAPYAKHVSEHLSLEQARERV